MKVYLFGYNGNMARRYRAILDFLGHEHGGEDVDGVHGFPHKDADALIVATPTYTHCDLLQHLRRCGKPILCEKPLSTFPAQLEACLTELKEAGTRLSMVSQYDYLIDPKAEGETIYDYYRSGADGLFWDCINIVKHAKGPITLRNKSPFWKCMVNGQILNIEDMDYAYIDMMEDWLKYPGTTDFDGIRAAHRKVYALEASCLF